MVDGWSTVEPGQRKVSDLIEEALNEAVEGFEEIREEHTAFLAHLHQILDERVGDKVLIREDVEYFTTGSKRLVRDLVKAQESVFYEAARLMRDEISDYVEEKNLDELAGEISEMVLPNYEENM